MDIWTLNDSKEVEMTLEDFNRRNMYDLLDFTAIRWWDHMLT